MPKLTQRQWDDLVDQWNNRNRATRRQAAETCAARGHQLARLPLPGMTICRRCCAYFREDGS